MTNDNTLASLSVRVVVPPLKLPPITYILNNKLSLPLPRSYVFGPDDISFVELDSVPKNWRCVRRQVADGVE